MKPLILTPLYPPAVGGAATYFGQLAEALARRPEIDHLTLLSEAAPAQPRRQRQGKLTVLRLLPPRVSIPTRPYPLHAFSYLRTQLWFTLRLPALIRQEGSDRIHFHTRYGGRLFYRALGQTGVPVVADLRDKLSDPARLAARADLLMCCGEGVVRFAVHGGFPPERVRLIPVAFTPPPLPPPAQIEAARRRYGLGHDPFLLYAGDINAGKGVLSLLSAFTHWRDYHPGVHLLLAGVNRLGPAFPNLVRKTPGAQYLGSVTHGDTLTLMAAAEIVLLPSYSEGLPRVMLEALALGRRVLAPPGIPEFERHLPDFVLPEITLTAIVAGLERVWAAGKPPPYPFDVHTLPRVADQLVAVYRELGARRHEA